MRDYTLEYKKREISIFIATLIPLAVLAYHSNIELGSLGSFSLIAILVLVLVLANYEIPIYKTRTIKPEHLMKNALLLEKIYGVPVLKELEIGTKRTFDTTVSLNLGGFILPLITLIYVLVSNHNTAILLITSLMIIAVFLASEMVDGIGIVIPNYISLLAIPLALLVAPSSAAEAVYIASVSGILVGTLISAATFNREKKGSAYLSIGGAGSFIPIYVTFLISVILAFFM